VKALECAEMDVVSQTMVNFSANVMKDTDNQSMDAKMSTSVMNKMDFVKMVFVKTLQEAIPVAVLMVMKLTIQDNIVVNLGRNTVTQSWTTNVKCHPKCW